MSGVDGENKEEKEVVVGMTGFRLAMQSSVPPKHNLTDGSEDRQDYAPTDRWRLQSPIALKTRKTMLPPTDEDSSTDSSKDRQDYAPTERVRFQSPMAPKTRKTILPLTVEDSSHR